MKKIILLGCFLTAMTFAGVHAQTTTPTDNETQESINGVEVNEATEINDNDQLDLNDQQDMLNDKAEVAEVPEIAEVPEVPEVGEKAETPDTDGN